MAWLRITTRQFMLKILFVLGSKRELWLGMVAMFGLVC